MDPLAGKRCGRTCGASPLDGRSQQTEPDAIAAAASTGASVARHELTEVIGEIECFHAGAP